MVKNLEQQMDDSLKEKIGSNPLPGSIVEDWRPAAGQSNLQAKLISLRGLVDNQQRQLDKIVTGMRGGALRASDLAHAKEEPPFSWNLHGLIDEVCSALIVNNQLITDIEHFLLGE